MSADSRTRNQRRRGSVRPINGPPSPCHMTASALKEGSFPILSCKLIPQRSRNVSCPLLLFTKSGFGFGGGNVDANANPPSNENEPSPRG
jgi:hypothetical protein